MAVHDRMLTQELKKMAFRNHVDLIGVTDLRVFDDIPIKEKPVRILSDAKAVIVYAVKFESAAELSRESWYSQMEKLLIRIDKKLRAFLTEKGYKAHSFTTEIDFHLWTDELHKRPFSERSLARQPRWYGIYRKLQDAAVSAGLGSVGKNRLLITPQYGPNVHLSMIITDAPLEPDAPFEEDPCAGCNLCLEACPTGALTALTGRGRPDESKCKPWNCHLACLRVCHEKWLKQRQQLDEQQKST